MKWLVILIDMAGPDGICLISPVGAANNGAHNRTVATVSRVLTFKITFFESQPASTPLVHFAVACA